MVEKVPYKEKIVKKRIQANQEIVQHQKLFAPAANMLYAYKL